MKNNRIYRKTVGFLFIALMAIIALSPDFAEAKSSFASKRSGSKSFGGSRSSSYKNTPSAPRSSFGGSKSSSPQSTAPRSSFGGSKSTPSPAMSPSASSFSNRASSFGGRSMSRDQAQMKYGTPRRTETRSYRDNNGMNVNYRMHDYGGFGSGYASGLMTGYMMGHSSWYWRTPFHPAYYYSAPVYAVGHDGVPEMYPPVFSFVKLLFTLIVIAAIIFIIMILIKSRKRRSLNSSSFS